MAFALKWAGSEPGGAAYLASLSVARAENRQEFPEALDALEGAEPELRLRRRRRQHRLGRRRRPTPIRKGWDGLLPVPGAAGKYEWQGYLPVPDLPQSFHPPTHWLATANHNILPPGYVHTIAYEWSAPHRFLRIQQRLTAERKFTLDDFQSIQHDNTSLPAQALIGVLKQVNVPARAGAIRHAC